MTEKEWADSIKEFLSSENLSEDLSDNAKIKISTLTKLPYAIEILEYTPDFEPSEKPNSMRFETDFLVYEQNGDVIKPRIIIEAKLSKITTHDAITYSYKAQNHKTVTPFIRYGIMIGNRKHYPLPGRLFRHGTNFDFMISFKREELNKNEKTTFVDLIKKELNYSRQSEEMLLNSRSSDRNRYYVMQKELRLVEMD